jgi:hypothetical protein
VKSRGLEDRFPMAVAVKPHPIPSLGCCQEGRILGEFPVG